MSPEHVPDTLFREHVPNTTYGNCKSGYPGIFYQKHAPDTLFHHKCQTNLYVHSGCPGLFHWNVCQTHLYNYYLQAMSNPNQCYYAVVSTK